ncbi:MAG TPA: hypothetical protein VK589_19850, partial [Chryseolinea sp.]|nr:hypothetical protein [Chryseolinea sp.]
MSKPGSQKKYRYPGLRSFEPAEHELFFGRSDEIQDLYTYVKHERIVTLFGKSGLGKSSLINAGLCQRLKANNYYPIRIRFGIEQSETLLSLFYITLQQDPKLSPELNNIHREENDQWPKIWETIKFAADSGILEDHEHTDSKSPITHTEKIIVLIFDQFEEFFTYPKDQQAEFMGQLSELAFDQPPIRVLNPLLEKKLKDRTDQDVQRSKQPEIRMLFSVRSDALHNLDNIKTHLPGILRNRFELKPLNKQKAYEAIIGPSKPDAPNFVVPSFEFDKVTLDLIKEFLSNAYNEVESSQLQIVCNYVEVKLEEYHLNGQTKRVVTDEIINDSNIKGIIDDYYFTQLRKLKDLMPVAREIMEEALVSSGRRASLTHGQMLAKVGVHKTLIPSMLESRLIREEYTHLGLTYEISHDTLVPAVEKSFERRKLSAQRKELEREKKVRELDLEEKKAQLENEMLLKQEAEIARDLAEKAKSEAEAARYDAELARNEAISAKELAENAKEDAERAREHERKSKVEAEHARETAILEREKATASQRRFKVISGFLLIAFVVIVVLAVKSSRALVMLNQQVAASLNAAAQRQYEFGRDFKAFKLWEYSSEYSQENSFLHKEFYAVRGSNVLPSDDESLIVSTYSISDFGGAEGYGMNELHYMVDVWKNSGGPVTYDYSIRNVETIDVV